MKDYLLIHDKCIQFRLASDVINYFVKYPQGFLSSINLFCFFVKLFLQITICFQDAMMFKVLIFQFFKCPFTIYERTKIHKINRFL